MHEEARLDAFLASLEEQDGFPPLSDAKREVFGEPDASIVITEQDQIVAVGACAGHLQTDGTIRYAIETAVEPSMRFPQFEAVVLDSTMALAPDPRVLSIWSNRPSLDRVVESLGWVVVRSLMFMTVDFPIPPLDVDGPRYDVRTFTGADVGALVSANSRAFAGHREAASLSEEDVAQIMQEPWFDPRGLFLLFDGGEVVGFCWTRIHDNGDGEIYRIGIVPDRTGSGAGKLLLSTGFAYLAEHERAQRGVLWVDASNERALNLYRSVGMRPERTIREYEQS